MRRTSHVLVFHAIVLLAAATAHAQGIARIPATIDQERTAMRGNVHPLAQARFDTGRVAGSLSLERITLFFNRTAAQQAELDDLLVAQQDPSSPQYHKWLTPEQYADRFGVSEADMARAAQWLKAQGFTIIEMTGGRQYIAFNGTAAQVEAAFGTEIHNYVVRGETHFANASEPTLPRSLAEVTQGIRGLHDFRPKARGVRARPMFTSNITGNHFLVPDDFATIYDLKPLYDQGIDGTGQKLAVMGQTNIPSTDIATFRSLSGLSANLPTVVQIPGSNTSVSTNDIGEADLDVEWAGAVARNAQIIYVNSGTTLGAFDSLTYAINNNVAPVLSISYGDCEAHWSAAEITTFTNLFQTANGQGQTVVGPSGDTGAADCEAVNATTATHGLAVDFPASSAFVTGVGGTMFNEGPNPASQYWSSTNNSVYGSALSYMPEMVWNETSANPTNCTLGSTCVLVAGGGGISTLLINGNPNAKPAYQTALTPADGKRDVPDISLAAGFIHDGYLICASQQSPADCTNGFRNVNTILDAIGGTSAGAPTFAGMVALLNQKKGGTQGNVNTALYALAAGSTDAFHDITTGSNIVPCAQASTNCPASAPFQIGYNAGAGYDYASGLGTVDAYNLISELASGTTSTPPPPDFTISATGPLTVLQGNSGNSTITTTVTGNFPNGITLSATGMPAGVTAGFVPNTITAPGSGSSTLTLNVSANTAPGTYPITVTGTPGGTMHSTTVNLVVPDFTISGTTPVTVLQGNSGNSTITTTVTGNFPSGITLSASGMPAGVTTGFAPNPIASPGSGSSTLTFNVAASTTPGTYPIMVTGTSGVTTHNTTVNLTVTGPDFTFAPLGSTTLTVTHGTSQQVSMNLQGTNGFSGNVTFSCNVSAALAGVTCTLPSPNPMAVSGSVVSATFMINASATAKLAPRPGSSPTFLAWTGGGTALMAGFLLIGGDDRKRRGRKAIMVLGVTFIAMLLLAAMLAGCGGSSGGGLVNPPPGFTPESGTVTLQAASGANVHTVTVNVTVN